jgi:hypothetical protein
MIKKLISFLKSPIRPFSKYDECIVFGSGPSLNNLNSSSAFLKNKDLIGCNFINHNINLMNKKFKYYSIIDRDYSKKINKYFFSNLNSDQIIISTKNMDLINSLCLLDPKIKIIKTIPFRNEMRLETLLELIKKNIYLTGNSIPFLLILLLSLNVYKKIYIYGVDHYSNIEIKNNNLKNFDNYIGREIKPLKINHEKLFYINNFYKLTRDYSLKQMIEIYNVTPNSKLSVFKKLEVKDLSTN